MLFCLVTIGSNNEVLIGKLCLSSGSISLSRGMCQSMILFCLSPNLAIYSSCLYRMRDLLQYLMVGVAPGISFVQRDRIIIIITLQNITHIRNQINNCNMIKIGLNLFFNNRFSKRKMIYNFQNQKLQMEDILQTVSNGHRSMYYAVQLKLMDVSQNIKLMGTSFKENDLKIAVVDMLNHSYMLESIFEQAKIPHIYQLIKTIAVNFNSVIAILLQKLDKATKKEINMLQLQHKEQSQTKKNDEGVISHGNLMKEIKKNRLGGIHLFNENYSRYIEDQMILDQIKTEKMKRLQMKRMDILRESVLQDLKNLTDVQEFPAKSDDIANYIIQAKDKNSMFNYVSYQPQLQEILEFFHKSQNEANKFLMRKMRDIGEQQGQFSFADFQRDIQLKNFQFRKKVKDKMNGYTDKYRTKQKQLQEYLKKKQNQFRQIQKSKMKCDKQVQTQIIFEEQLIKFNKTIKELTEKCHSYQIMTKQHINNERQKQISRQLVQRQADIEKQNKKMAQLQLTIQSLKQLLKDQKIKRINSSKSIDFRSQRTIPQPAPFVQKQRKLYIPKKQKDQQNMAILQNNSSQKNTQNIKKAKSVNNLDRLKRHNSDSASFLSFHDVDKDKFGRQTLKAQKKITVKYQQNKLINKSEQNKQQTSLCESKEAPEHPKVSFTEINSKNQLNKVDNIAKAQKIEHNKGEHSKQQFANNSNQINSSSSKNIEGQLIKKQLKMINDNMNSIIKSKGTPSSLKKIKFEYKQSLNNTPQKEIKETMNEVQNKSKIEQKLKKQVQADVEGKISSKRQKIVQDNTKKQKSQYQMYQVTEEEHEQQTAKPSFANSKQPSIKSLPSNQKTLIQKLNEQLKKIKNQKTLQLKKLYSLTINPSPHIVVKSNKKQSSLAQESDIIIHNDNKSYKKVMKLFENLIQNGSTSQINAQKVRKWKRTMLSNLKSNIISQDQIDQITAVIRGISFTKGHAFVYENSVTSVASISHHIRNSLPQIQQITNLSPKIKISNTKKSKNLLTVPENQQEKNKQNQRLVSLSQYQQQIEGLIKNQSLQTNFPQKFHRLHKNCEQGTLCTHVTKYFEAIMRYYEQLKKKQRPSYALPVQRIGNRSRIQQQAINKDMKQSQQNKSLQFQKSSQKLKHNRNSSLLKNRYSQQIILPNINDYKMKNASHSVFKQQMI